MLTLKRFFAFFGLLIFPLPTFAAELSGDIPRDLANILFDPESNGQFVIYTDIPSDFPQFDMPGGITLIASMRQGRTKVLSLETQLPEENSIALISAALTANGWVDLPLRSASNSTGFVAATEPVSPRPSPCHDQLGRASFRFGSHNGRQVLTLSTFHYPAYNQNEQTCQQQAEQQIRLNATLNPVAGINSYMPTLRAPVGTFPTGFSPSRFLPTLNRDLEAQSQVILKLDWTIENTFNHFAAQIANQGWLQDNISVGGVSATGIWTKVTPDGSSLVGTLTAVAVGEERIEMKFLIRMTD